MLSYQKGVVKTSVRHLVEFLFRGGDITTGSSENGMAGRKV